MSQPKSNEEIAQYVIDNRYPKSELEKVSDVELYHFVLESLAQKDAEVAAAYKQGYKDGVGQPNPTTMGALTLIDTLLPGDVSK